MASKLSQKQITFIITGFSHGPVGGVKIVYEYANALTNCGCEVTICSWCPDSLKQYPLPEILRRPLCVVFTALFPRWFKLDRRVKKKCIFTIDDNSIPKGTDVVATAVETAAPVALLNPESGRKHYLIQDFETWSTAESDVRATYRLGMSNIVVSDWLKRLVQNESGIEPRLIKNPIETDVFFPEPGICRNAHEVACLYHVGEHKGFTDLYDALKIVKSSIPDLVVNSFGSPERPDWLPEWFHYTRSANEEQLREIYSRSAVFACATVNEGFGLTLPESMFCGCALASTRFQGVWEYADENCAKLSPVHDPEALATNIIAMLEDPDGTAVLAARGREHAMAECSVEKAQEALRSEFGI